VYAKLQAVPLRDMLAAAASCHAEPSALAPPDQPTAFSSERLAPSANAELIEALQAAHDALVRCDPREAAAYAAAVRTLRRAQAEAHVAQALTLSLGSSATARSSASVLPGELGSREEEAGASAASTASWGWGCRVM
jgi:hypothetical protein